MQNAPANIVVEESADFPTATLVPAPRMGFIHRNEHSVVPLTLAHQGLKEVASIVHDPILHRTFGLLMGGVGAREKEGSTEWSPVLIADGKSTDFHVAAPCVQGGDVSAWLLTANDLLNSADSVRSAEANLVAWQRYWGKSWILTAGESAPSVPTNGAPARDPAPPRLDSARLSFSSSGSSGVAGSGRTRSSSTGRSSPSILSLREGRNRTPTGGAGATAIGGRTRDSRTTP
jgi:hypothetical protein